MYEAQKSLQVCVTCVPADGAEITHESSTLIMAGHKTSHEHKADGH